MRNKKSWEILCLQELLLFSRCQRKALLTKDLVLLEKAVEDKQKVVEKLGSISEAVSGKRHDLTGPRALKLLFHLWKIDKACACLARDLRTFMWDRVKETASCRKAVRGYARWDLKGVFFDKAR